MRSFGDNVAHRASREASPIREHEREWERGLDGMANTCELLINVVIVDGRSRAGALGRKAREPVERLLVPFSQTLWSPAERQSLTRPVPQMKQGKPVRLPMGRRVARSADRRAGMGCPRKRRPGRNGRDSGVLPQRESVPTSDRSCVTMTYEDACIKEKSEP